jgi:hypothetical protein
MKGFFRVVFDEDSWMKHGRLRMLATPLLQEVLLSKHHLYPSYCLTVLSWPGVLETAVLARLSSSCFIFLFCSRKEELFCISLGIETSIPASNPNVNSKTKIKAREALYLNERKLTVTTAEFCNAKRTIAIAIKRARTVNNRIQPPRGISSSLQKREGHVAIGKPFIVAGGILQLLIIQSLTSAKRLGRFVHILCRDPENGSIAGCAC